MLDFYQAVGGEPTFRLLVQRFYDQVERDPVLRAVYPEAGLGAAREHLTLFLIQYWGGPTTYSDQRGHPRLRLRHAPFQIGPRERDAWFMHMSAAVRSLRLEPQLEAQMLRYFDAASTGLINRPG